ncbi:MAG: PAS domain-containing protein [Bacteroidetes bacterium]|nr:PAS domain-containing protein [Bacteroidota bacterium]
MADKENNMDLDRRLADYVLNHSHSMLSVVSRNYVYERVNARLCLAHAGNRNDIEGKTLEEVWGTKNFLQNIKPRVDRCLQGETVLYEAGFETPEKGYRLYQVTLRPFNKSEGVVTHLLAESIDVTEIREAESAVRQIEEEFRNLERMLPVGFLRTENDGRLIHMNPACREILGIPDDFITDDLNFGNLYADISLFGIHTGLLEENPTRSLGRTRLKTHQGKEISCRLTGYLVRNTGGSVSHIDFAIEDVTREQYLEDRLVHARKLETVGALAGGIAHDFNNILAAIFGYAEMSVNDLPEGSALSENMKKIISSVSRARSLTRQVLTFSRHIEQEKVPVDPCRVITETINYVMGYLPEGIEIENNTSDNCRLVYADPTQLFRVFLNLINNAIQAMEPSGGKLTISLEVRNFTGDNRQSVSYISGEHVLITFSDTGRGMEKAVLERIFEPFFTTRDIGKGTGLGLSVVHGIISELGGEIDVTSQPGAGSSFTLSIPSFDSEGKAVIESLPERRLLVISDNIYESGMLCMGLENSGYTLTHATSADGLLNCLRKKNSIPDLIVHIDGLPDFPANDLLLLIERTGINLPILVITGEQDLISGERFLNSLHRVQFLIKPVSLREVRNAVEVILTGK